jgi:hypothetical protein
MDFVEDIKSLSIGSDARVVLSVYEDLWVSANMTESFVLDQVSDLVHTEAVEAVFCATPVISLYILH